MNISNEQLTLLLVNPNHITKEQFDESVLYAGDNNRSVTSVLIEKNYISDENLGRVLADGLGYPFLKVKDERIDRDTLTLIPEAVARTQQTIAYKQDENILYLATVNPDNYEFQKLIEKKAGKRLAISYTTESNILEALKNYRSDFPEKIKNLVKDLKERPENESGIIELVDLILQYSYHNGTSDIHIEPMESKSIIRFRIDGVLHEIVSYPKSLHETIVFRLKILSRLRIDEQSANQDGRFEYKDEHAKFDVRVSIVPTIQGENVVMRLLTGESSHHTTLVDLGYSQSQINVVRKAIEKPYGMILSVGPTGSGKSTTLYTLLQLLNNPEVNIMTIEDPVEFNIEHIQQIPVNVKKDVTFSTGLRSIVRQDPDIIMVGEIRDSDTANIAVNAAMTGHLLLSTLHANDAATTFPRLIDLGVEPFLLASSLNMVVAQRLVRKICDKCRESYELTEQEKIVINENPEVLNKIEELSQSKILEKVRLYRGAGCNSCNNTGYAGRIGIFEIFEIVQELRTLIIQKSSADVILQKARSMGMESMASDGVRKMFEGVTTLEEVIRVTKS